MWSGGCIQCGDREEPVLPAPDGRNHACWMSPCTCRQAVHNQSWLYIGCVLRYIELPFWMPTAVQSICLLPGSLPSALQPELDAAAGKTHWQLAGACLIDGCRHI